jgi:spermidine synthase
MTLETLRGRLAAADTARRRTRPADLGLADDLALLGTFVAGPESLARFAANAPLNTDDRPLVSYLAPRLTYAPTSKPRERLLALLEELSIGPGEVLAPIDASFGMRLAKYWEARERFLAAGRDVRSSTEVREMLSQVREPLLESLQISPDFRPAYDPLLQMALALASVDRANARALLLELEAIQPLRSEAAQALLALESAQR